VKEVGGKNELDFCENQYARSALEDEPRQVRVYDVGLVLEALEMRVARGRVGKSANLSEMPEEEKAVSTLIQKFMPIISFFALIETCNALSFV
jgi:hypothetical protein